MGESAKKKPTTRKSKRSKRTKRTPRNEEAAQPEETAETLREQLHAMRAIGETLAGSGGLDRLFTELVPNVSKLMHAERSTLFLYDAGTNEIWSKVAEGEGGREIRLKAGQGIAGSVAETRDPINVADAYRDERFNSNVDAKTGFRTRSLAATPLLDRRGNLLGVLQVLNRKGGPFTEHDMGLLSIIAVQASYVVENAHQAQELLDQNAELIAARHRAERRRAELDLLFHLEQETSESDNLDQLLDSIIVRTCERLRSTAGSVLLSDDDTGKLYFRGVTGENTEGLRRLTLEPGEGVVGWVAEKGEPLVVNRPEEDERHRQDIADDLNVPAHALLAVPLIWDKRVIGAVEVLNPKPRPTGATGYDLDDLKVLTLIAGQVARAVALTRERQRRMETERLAFIGQMLAGVAHDLRNPMTVISGFTQMMALEDDASQRDARCERILRQIDEMTAMVGDLLAFARGDTQLHPGVSTVDHLGKEIETAMTMQCEPRGIELAVDYDDAKLYVDVGRAKRIISNLARNAVEVLKRGEKLEISLKGEDRGLRLEVADSGPGMPPEIRARLFEPFFTAGKKNGTGLGLSIVKRFVSDHKGTVEVDTKEGKGTTFSVWLPAATDPA